MKDIRMNRATCRHLMMIGVLLSLFFRLSGADARIQLKTPSLLTVPPHIRTDSKRKFEFGIDTPARGVADYHPSETLFDPQREKLLD